MAKNINFISAAELPEATGEEVSVLCLENGEMKQKPANGLGGGGFMEVEITLSDSSFTSGNVTFNKTYDEIKNAMEKGYFVMGLAKNKQFKDTDPYYYSNGYIRPMFPKYAADMNGGTIIFIPADSSTGTMCIQADGTMYVTFD